MTPRQKRLYDQLREHYRVALDRRIRQRGFKRSGVYILEALLRLRQAACHFGLVDLKRLGESSAKHDALLPLIRETIAKGHKALVFSQFTSHLDILRRRLDRLELSYEYLDGGTRDREARVDRFQKDKTCRLFLISLKAGGVGLNLTAANRIFLLDPWWNPAVEAQAIDRAHRIGQSDAVLARRLITRGTVEEKILDLQSRKRDLAASIIGEAPGTLRSLTRSDLEFLLTAEKS